jgi:hypothetical protein
MLKNKKGFTLLELIVVIVVAGLLAAIAIPSFNNVKTEAKKQAGFQEAAAFVKSVNALAAFTTANDASTKADVAADELGGSACYTNSKFVATNGVAHAIEFSGDTAALGAMISASVTTAEDCD